VPVHGRIMQGRVVVHAFGIHLHCMTEATQRRWPCGVRRRGAEPMVAGTLAPCSSSRRAISTKPWLHDSCSGDHLGRTRARGRAADMAPNHP
jgi:hypothetical protein